MAEKELWWAAAPDVFDAGEPRRLKARPSTIPEPSRVKRTIPPSTEDEALRRVKQDAIRMQGLLLRQLLAADRHYDAFAPEVPAYIRFKQIAYAHRLTMEQVQRALQLAHELA